MSTQPQITGLRSFFKSIYTKLTKEDDCLPSLNEIVDLTKARKESYIGLREIPVDNIIGSEGRYDDFNKNFLPKKAALKGRWSSINEIVEQNISLPSISVFKIDDYYFVRDGNHRVSVAKSRKQAYIDAEVTEYYIDVPLTKELTIKDRIKIQEHVNFLEATGLNTLGKGFDIKLTRPRSYRLLLNIIKHLEKPLEESAKRQLSLQEVSWLWYNQVFLPFSETAYHDDLLAKFPNRTTGDLYVWLQMNWNEVKDSLGERMSILAKPMSSEQSDISRSQTLPFTQTRVPGNKSGFRRTGISIVVTCVVLNISKKGEISVVIVKRKYHPFEDYWSLPFAILNEDETRLTGAERCVRDSLGIRKKIDFIQYETFDNVDRSPFGRVVACGMIGIHFGENIHLSAGGVASEIKLKEVKDIPELVYDHNLILNMALRYIYRIRNNFSFIKELFPDNIPLKYIRKLLREVRDFEHRRKERERRPGIFDR
jgi:ADP-ribose pyrophosphatase YjhB (NUDIX family)